MSEIFDLDWELVTHLSNSEAVFVLRREQFSSELIEEESVKKIFDWQMAHLRQHNQPATLAVLQDQFGDLGLTEPQTAIGDLIDRLRRRYVRNEGQDSVERLVKTTKKDPLGLAGVMVQEGRKLHSIVTPKGESFGSGDHDQAMNTYNQRILQGRGPSLGFIEIDDHFHGQSGITYLVGAPKSMKSWIAVKTVIENVRQGFRAYLYSLELPAIDTLWRIKCMQANVPYWKYIKGALDAKDQQRVEQASEELDRGWFKVDKPEPGKRTVHDLVERAINAEADCVFIDQLQYVEDSGGDSLGAMNDTGRYFNACNVLRDYSDEIPIFVVHQFNRSILQTIKSGEEPDFQQVKGSAAIEETATLELAIHSNKDMRASNVIHLKTLLSRHFTLPTWEIGVRFDNECKLMLNGEVV